MAVYVLSPLETAMRRAAELMMEAFLENRLVSSYYQDPKQRKEVEGDLLQLARDLYSGKYSALVNHHEADKPEALKEAELMERGLALYVRHLESSDVPELKRKIFREALEHSYSRVEALGQQWLAEQEKQNDEARIE